MQNQQTCKKVKKSIGFELGLFDLLLSNQFKTGCLQSHCISEDVIADTCKPW